MSTPARAEYIASVLADWPAPTPHQMAVIRHNLYGDAKPGPAGPSDYELDQHRLMYERENALRDAQKIAKSLTACDVCNLQPDAHRIRQAQGVDFHEWTPGRAQKILDGKTS